MPDMEEQVVDTSGAAGDSGEAASFGERLDFHEFVDQIAEANEPAEEPSGGEVIDSSEALPSNPAEDVEPESGAGDPPPDAEAQKVYVPAWGRDVEVTAENFQRIVEENRNWQSRYDREVSEIRGELNALKETPRREEPKPADPTPDDMRSAGMSKAVDSLRSAGMNDEQIRSFLGGIMQVNRATESEIDRRVSEKTSELEEKYGKYGEYVEKEQAGKEEVRAMADFLDTWEVPYEITPEMAAVDRRLLEDEARRLKLDPDNPTIKRKIDRYQIKQYAQMLKEAQNGTEANGNGSQRKPASSAPIKPRGGGPTPKQRKEAALSSARNSDLVSQIIAGGGFQ